MKKIGIILLTGLFLAQAAMAQLNSLSRADRSYQAGKYFSAVELYMEAVERGNEPDYVTHRLADCYRLLRDFKNAEVWYAQAVQLRDRTPSEIYHYAQALKSNEKYSEANNWMRYYNELVPEDRRGVMHVTAGDYEKYLNPVVQDYIVSNLSINTVGNDFGPAFFGDRSIVYCSNFEDNDAAIDYTWGWTGDEYLDLYIADRVAGGALNTPQKFSKAINSKYHEGPCSFSTDGLQIYFTRNTLNSRGTYSGFNNLKIYRAALAGNDFVNIEPLPFTSDEYNVCNPSMNKQGTKLFFASDMPGGFGGYDLYVVTFDRGFWGRPVNLGPEVNTEGNENFPFIHESNTLYFASDGHVGIGGMDVFMATYSRGKYKGVTNLKAPINSSKDDFGFILDSAATSGYIASNREGGKGMDDLYAFVYEKQETVYDLQGQVVDENEFTVAGVTVYVQNEKGTVLGKAETDEDGFFSFKLNRNETYKLVTQSEAYDQGEVKIPVFPAGDVKTVNIEIEKSRYSVAGVVLDDATKLAMDGVTVKLTKSSSQRIQETVSDRNGKFGFVLDPNSVYTLRIMKPGYLTKSKVVSTVGVESGKQLQAGEITLSKIQVNEVIEIPNVYYDLGKSEIRPDAAVELDKVVAFLRENPNITVELSSHTDSRGDAISNLELSQERADAAMNYIVGRGIGFSRIMARGFGETRLKNRCRDGVKCSETEHQENRRTEIKIISIQ